MTGFLLKALPWVLLAGSLFLSGKIYIALRDQKKETAAANKKTDDIKLNIDRLAGYQSADQEIRVSAEKNIKEFKEARSDDKVKKKLDKLYSDINSIYYRK